MWPRSRRLSLASALFLLIFLQFISTEDINIRGRIQCYAVIENERKYFDIPKLTLDFWDHSTYLHNSFLGVQNIDNSTNGSFEINATVYKADDPDVYITVDTFHAKKSVPDNCSVRGKHKNSVILRWNLTEGNITNEITVLSKKTEGYIFHTYDYDVTINYCDCTANSTPTPSSTIIINNSSTTLRPSTANTKRNSNRRNKKRTPAPKSDEGSSTELVVGIAVPILVVVVFAIAATIYYCNRENKMEGTAVERASGQKMSSSSAPSGPSSSSHNSSSVDKDGFLNVEGHRFRYKGQLNMDERFHGDHKHRYADDNSESGTISQIVFDPALNEAVGIDKGDDLSKESVPKPKRIPRDKRPKSVESKGRKPSFKPESLPSL